MSSLEFGESSGLKEVDKCFGLNPATRLKASTRLWELDHSVNSNIQSIPLSSSFCLPPCNNTIIQRAPVSKHPDHLSVLVAFDILVPLILPESFGNSMEISPLYSSCPMPRGQVRLGSNNPVHEVGDVTLRYSYALSLV